MNKKKPSGAQFKRRAQEKAKQLDAYPKLTSFFTGGAAAAGNTAAAAAAVVCAAGPSRSEPSVSGEDGVGDGLPLDVSSAAAEESVVVAGPSGRQE